MWSSESVTFCLLCATIMLLFICFFICLSRAIFLLLQPTIFSKEIDIMTHIFQHRAHIGSAKFNVNYLNCSIILDSTSTFHNLSTRKKIQQFNGWARSTVNIVIIIKGYNYYSSFSAQVIIWLLSNLSKRLQPSGPHNSYCCWQVVVAQIYLYIINTENWTLKHCSL